MKFNIKHSSIESLKFWISKISCDSCEEKGLFWWLASDESCPINKWLLDLLRFISTSTQDKKSSCLFVCSSTNLHLSKLKLLSSYHLHHFTWWTDAPNKHCQGYGHTPILVFTSFFDCQIWWMYLRCSHTYTITTRLHVSNVFHRWPLNWVCKT